MEKEKIPKNYMIKAVCLNCNNVDELKIPFGVESVGKNGIYLHSDEKGQYYNLDTNRYQNTAFYPTCSKCGSTSLKKTMHIENAIEVLEEKIDSTFEQLRKIKTELGEMKK